MSLHILQNTHAIGVRCKTPFLAVEGTAPYVYSVSGSAAGSIDTDGLYTAGSRAGVDTIRVVDAVLAAATATINVMTPLELVCDIIQQEMDLDDGQVYLWDQKFKIPTDSRLYVAVSVISCKPFGNNRRLDSSGLGLDGVQSVNMSATLGIDIFSRSSEARTRKEEIILALNSFYAEQQQEANSFRIFPLTDNFVNLSDVDGAAIPYRFTISANLQYFVTKTRDLEYFENFEDVEVITDPEEG